jgi:pimeloyl-ACP methyl ester carboxylesterase
VATYVLIHGAGGSDSWYWHLVVPQLRSLGHDVVAPDLPCEDESAGWDRYADVVMDAVGDREDLVVVGQSLGGFTAPLVCQQARVGLLVMVAAMVPKPGESASEWFAATGWAEAHLEQAARDGRPTDAAFDPMVEFFHDVPADVVAEAWQRGQRQESAASFEQPWPLQHWPSVPTRFLLCRLDRFFPANFMRRVVEDRLGASPDELDSGHLPALGHPQELVSYLESCRIQFGS